MARRSWSPEAAPSSTSCSEGLVDELNLQVFPLLLGSGKRLYPASPDKTAMDLVASTALDTGVLLQTYRLRS